ncbi:hypothetical protein [Olleya sp. R77988]|uniref:hypothetical protein n=1 Tax=Olleya sp. R77988 TaxID=3093875 RepID=UPI0037C8A1E5
MNLSITKQSLKPELIYSINNYSGILNSNYKSIVKKNFKNIKSKSLFTRKQHLKSWSYNRTCSSAATSLKVLLFLVMTIIAII